jgi:hypothetical protein
MKSTTAKVKAVNAANAYGIELYKQLVPIFTPLVGEKIFKASGGLLAKYEKHLPEFPNTVPLSVYRNMSDYSLAWVVKTCEMVGEYSCLYYEALVYIGGLRNGVLEDISGPFEGRTDWTVEEVLVKRENLKNAEAIVSAIRSFLHPFGDRYDS